MQCVATIQTVARKQRIPKTPTEIIKDPKYLEFLGLKREAEYYGCTNQESYQTVIFYVNYFIH